MILRRRTISIPTAALKPSKKPSGRTLICNSTPDRPAPAAYGQYFEFSKLLMAGLGSARAVDDAQDVQNEASLSAGVWVRFCTTCGVSRLTRVENKQNTINRLDCVLHYAVMDVV
jgi:hypothetical protein